MTTTPKARVTQAVDAAVWQVKRLLGPISTTTCEVAGDDDLSILRHNLNVIFAAHRAAVIEEALKAIASLPTGRTEDVMEGQEQAYRAVEAIRDLGGDA